ncbi:MAG: carbohydrate kinase [Bacteroidota bacterium]
MTDNSKNINKILCVGEILWDMLPTGAKAGGAPMNVSLHLKKLGLNSIFAGRIGNDKLGYSLVEFLKQNGMDTSLIQVDAHFPTSTVEVSIGTDHQVKFDIIDNVAWDRFELTDELNLASEESDILVYGTLSSRHYLTRKTIHTLIDKPCLKLIDVNLRPPFIDKEVVEELLLKADIAKLNSDELKFIGGWYNLGINEVELTNWFAEKYKCQIVCITRGAEGALIFDNGNILENTGYKVNVIDTVGSGDAFLAGFLVKYLSGASLAQTLDFACATGALVATKAGGTPDYDLEEIYNIQGINNDKAKIL